MEFNDAQTYIAEAVKTKKSEDKEKLILTYSAVMWNRVEPKDIPSLSTLLESYDDEPVVPQTQSVREQEDALRTIAARFKAR